MTFADHVLSFYHHLKIKAQLPEGVAVLNPYQDAKVFRLCTAFYHKYFNDANQRSIIIGINPGRHGAGLTGIPFTDPVKLETICGIRNDLPKKSELSADFIHTMMETYGGTSKFFSRFYFSSVSPLGFTFNGKNLNYYDLPELAKQLGPFIERSIEKQLTFGIKREKAFCLGEGDNYKFLSQLNHKKGYFDEIVALAHPRFIMQYRRKKLDEYVDGYLRVLRE